MASIVSVAGPSGVLVPLDLDDAKAVEAHKASLVAPKVTDPVKLDLGCGTKKAAGFIGVDAMKFDGVDVVCNVGVEAWPWPDGTVDEANCSHMLEHLTWPQRVHFFNELHRVLKVGGKCQFALPHWSSTRYYGDPTHQSPFSEFGWFYLKQEWRKANAPHVDGLRPDGLGYVCDFDVSYGYTMHPGLTGRNQEYVNFAMTWYKEACQDMVATAVKR